MQQVALIQSGSQQWIKQPAAIHGDQFSFLSSLAVFVHASDSYRLVKLLSQQTQHVNALCWSLVEANLIACSNAEKNIRIYNLDTDAAVYSSHFPYPDIVSSLRWATHDESTLLAAAGSTVAIWPYKCTAQWKCLHSFRDGITCMQQSATEPRLLAVGCADASLHMFDMLLRKVVCTVKLDEAAVPCDLQFDPLSKAYLLLLCSNGALALYGISGEGNALDLVSSLSKQPAARRSAAFVPSQPGNFAVISTKSGILQLWNVSQQQPLRSLKVGNGPAQSLNFFPGSSRALLTFQDGTVVVYDVSTQERLWCTQPGHTETIFDCAFAPGPHLDMLATCSFDGTVRVWDATRYTCIKTLDTKAPGREEPVIVKGVPSNALYSVAWSPDCNLLAASSAGGAVYLFDYAKGIALKKWQLHSQPSLRVAWHPTKPTLLASSSLDGSVVVFQTDGSKLKTLQHSSAACGCAWASDSYLLATTSERGTVYVWDLNVEEGDCQVHALVGHAKRSFSALWSPLLPHLLLSGSDDATARVWDTRTGSCLALLAGHRSEVRALCWHPELPWLVLTGSWDSTIRCWDLRSQSCVHVCSQHHSDVYGLHIHTGSPWVLASANRDSTLRFWDLRGLAGGLLTRCFLEGVLPRAQADTYRDQTATVLCGPASQQLAEWLSAHGLSSKERMASPAACIELFARLSALFAPPRSMHPLWQLAAAVAGHLGEPAQALAGTLGSAQCAAAAAAAAGSGEAMARSSSFMPAGRLSNATSLCKPTPGSLSLDSRAGSLSIPGGPGGSSSSCCTGPGCVCHLSKVRSGLVSAANQLELSVRGRGAGRACLGAAHREEVLQEAAMMHLQAGDAERCCELLIELDRWDQALALAPAVSLTYWRQLLQRKVDALGRASATSKELLPYLLSGGQVAAAVEVLMRHKQLGAAANVAAVAACGGYARFTADDSPAGLRALAGSPPPRSSSMVSPTGSPTPLPPASLHGSAALSSSLEGLGASNRQLSLSGAASLSALSTKRNSLPPLRGMPSMPGAVAEPLSSPTGTVAGAAASAGGMPTSMSCSSLAPLGPGSRSGSLSGLSSLAHPEAAAVPSAQPGHGPCSPTEGGMRPAPQYSGGMRQSFGRSPASAPGVPGAFSAQLECVCRAQVQLHRSQGQPIKAAAAALMLHDVPSAVSALHLGHEPEQAAMLCVALGGLAGLHEGLVDRVFEALAVKCEAAGDWHAAALALAHLSQDAQHQQQLLAVRQERADRSSSSSSSSGGGGSAGKADDVCTGGSNSQQPQVSSSLRQELQLPSAEQCAGLARSAAGAVESVRYLLLAHEDGHATAKAVNSIQPLLADLQQQLLQSVVAPSSTTSPGIQSSVCASGASSQKPSKLLSSPPAAQLARWHSCLESLDRAELPPPCWHDVFAHLLLTGALKAFSYSYQEVGSFLFARLRHWVEEHSLKFPLSRPVLLLLEAELLKPTHPDAAASLLQAVLSCAGVTADVRAAADAGLQALATRSGAPAATALADSSCVVASNSSLPHQPPPVTIKRSAVSGKLLSSGPWAYADDGCSLLSMNEAVMLSHVMRFGPFGTGLVLQLLV